MAPSAIVAANNKLACIVAADRPLLLNGVELQLRQFHFGPAAYITGSRAAMHEHAELQIEYGMSGHFMFTDQQRDKPLEPGGAVIAAPTIPHSWECLSTGLMIGVLLRISGPCADTFNDALRRQSDDSLVPVDTPDQREHLQCLWQILSESPVGAWHEDRLAAQVRLLITHTLSTGYDLSRWCDARSHGQPDVARADATCERALNFMQANFARDIGLPDIALHAGVSTRHLSRLFRQQCDQTVNQALMQIRLTCAHDLLRHRQMSVKEVAFHSGFSSPVYFTQCYRRHFRQVPSAVLDAQPPGH